MRVARAIESANPEGHETPSRARGALLVARGAL
jgi:hypothetical protein